MPKQRKYHITKSDGTPTGETIMCAPEKAAKMSKVMGVKFMRHLPKPAHIEEKSPLDILIPA